MIRRLFASSIAVAAVCCAGVAFAQDAATIEKGKAVYDAAKPACKACHNEKKAPLDKYGATGTAEDAKAWLRTPKEMFEKTGKKGMMPAYSEKKMSDEDLDALAQYLVSLK
ncbi:MAG: cytochrome c [Acidobacteria bacterium]|jgi:mono/diheme cytochrome c family protein|nr:cytochrome c [Acidobacteriota bacterium]